MNFLLAIKTMYRLAVDFNDSRCLGGVVKPESTVHHVVILELIIILQRCLKTYGRILKKKRESLLKILSSKSFNFTTNFTTKR